MPGREAFLSPGAARFQRARFGLLGLRAAALGLALALLVFWGILRP